MYSLKNTDSIGIANVIRIIFNDKCITKYITEDKCMDFTFNEVLDIAKENTYKTGLIILIAESPLHGKIYEYGNYGDYWVKHGSTRGYA